MGLFDLFSRKNPEKQLQRGRVLLEERRFAEARVCFEDALVAGGDDLAEARALYETAGDRLAELNIEEARGHYAAGDERKGHEHATLALSLAADPKLRDIAGELLVERPREVAVSVHGGCGGSCSCSGGHDDKNAYKSPVEEDEHDLEMRFELLVGSLPGDLPQRYRDLGKEFAEAYVKAADGHFADAFGLLQRLSGAGQNDIVLYEMSIAAHNCGDQVSAEKLLRKAVAAREDNPLCRLTLAELLSGLRREDEAVHVLREAARLEPVRERSLLMLGELLGATGNVEEAIDVLVELLNTPYKKEAAGRLVPLLQHLGREREAAHIAKTHLKGCC